MPPQTRTNRRGPGAGTDVSTASARDVLGLKVDRPIREYTTRFEAELAAIQVLPRQVGRDRHRRGDYWEVMADAGAIDTGVVNGVSHLSRSLWISNGPPTVSGTVG